MDKKKIPQSEAIVAWRCFRCGMWNEQEHTNCKKCAAPSELYDAVQYHRGLTTHEDRFYKHSAPEMVHLLQSINFKLAEIAKYLKGSRGL